jgi:hypothetical protein
MCINDEGENILLGVFLILSSWVCGKLCFRKARTIRIPISKHDDNNHVEV